MKHLCPPRLRTRRHTLLRSACPALVAAFLMSGSHVKAASLTWDPLLTPATGSYGSGTWDAATTANWSSGGADVVFGTGNNAVFAGTSTGTATVTLGSAISALNLQFLSSGYTVTPSAANTLTLTGGFGTSGAGATIYAGAASGSTTTVGGPITVAATAGANNAAYFSAAAGNTLNLTGTITQTTPATSGNTVYGPGIVSYSGAGFSVGKFNVQGGATFNQSGALTGFTNTYAGIGGDTTTNSTWNVNAGGSVAGGAVTLFVGNGAIGGVNTVGTFSVNGSGTAIFTALNVGSTFNGGVTPGDSTGTVTVNGGTLTSNGSVRLGSTGAGVGTLNLTNGGRLVMTSSAAATIARANGTASTGGSGTINFNGGAIQYNIAPTTVPAIAANITAVVQDNGATINTNGFAVTAASPFIHGGVAAIDGGLTKTSNGILTLTATNTFTGPTAINGGGLSISTNGGLSSSNVTLAANTSLTLAAAVTAAHSNFFSTLTLISATTSLVNLNAATALTVQDTIGALVVNGVNQLPGTYGSATSGVPLAFQLADFTGNGVIVVTGAVPEPSTWAMMLVGLGGFGAFVVRRRRQA